MVRRVTELTHYNNEAIDGAVLQCAAVYLALRNGEKSDPTKVSGAPFNRIKFAQRLKEIVDDEHAEPSHNSDSLMGFVYI